MKIGWWNTNLFPPRANPVEPSEDRVSAALHEVRSLVDRRVDLIGLAEVSQRTVRGLSSKLGGAWRGRFTSARRNLGVLYDSTRVSVSAVEDLATGSDSGPHVASLVTVNRLNSDLSARLVVALIHWRTDSHEGQVAREECAKILNAKLKSDHAVILGDFNCEPFSRELVRSLRASRDRDLVRIGKADFFNPFWRHPNREGPAWASLRLERPSEEHLTLWRLVDFAVVSHSVAGPNNLDGEIVVVPSDKMTSDHLPVILSIPEERRRKS